MSLSADFIAMLQSIQKNLYLIGGLLLILFGTIGSIVNFIVFNQKTLRKNPCSICFVTFNAANFLLICLSLIPTILQLVFNIEPGIYNLMYCRWRYYIGFVLSCLAPSYLILASIDRTLITSPNARTRQWSNRAFIYKCLFGLTAFWMLFHIHSFFYITILQYGPDYSLCYYQSGSYTNFMSYYALIITGFLPLLLLSIFGLLTLKNMHRRPMHSMVMSHSVTHATTTRNPNQHDFHRKDRQLIRMLSMEVCTCFIFNFTYPAVLLYQQITQYQTQDATRLAILQLLSAISGFLTYIPYCTSFYTNLFASKTFRKEVKTMICKNRMNRMVRPL